MRRGELKFTAEEAAAIREAERQAGYAPFVPATTGVGATLLEGVVVGGLDGLGTPLGAIVAGAGHGLAELGHAIDDFFRALFISAAVALAVGLVVFVLTHAYESTPPETMAQVEATSNQPEPGMGPPRRSIPYKEYQEHMHTRVSRATPADSFRKLEQTKPALREPRALRCDIATVAPPAPATDDTPKLEETARWQGSETDEPPILRREVFPQPESPTTVAQVQPRTECQVAPQSEMIRSHAAVREVEHDEA